MGVAEGVERVVADKNHGVAALQHAHGVRDAGAQAVAALGEVADELGRDLRVRVRAEGDAHLYELAAEGVEVDQRAVVREGDDGVIDVGEVRLGRLPTLGARRAVAAMSAGHVPGQGREVGVGEHLRDEAQVLADEDGLAVAHRDTGGLLTAVLQGAQREVGHAGDVLAGGPDAKDAALLVQGVAVWLPGPAGLRRTLV